MSRIILTAACTLFLGMGAALAQTAGSMSNTMGDSGMSSGMTHNTMQPATKMQPTTKKSIVPGQSTMAPGSMGHSNMAPSNTMGPAQ
ncbi:MAG TPA: hypothetical protein PLY97_07660 [Acidocella sp.]|nr:hypothetical protein [Acidocella sp.]